MSESQDGKSKKQRERLTSEKLREEAQFMTRLALETLGEIMESAGSETVRLAAAREVLDRGHGRPKAEAAESDAKADGGMTVIVKRFTDITPEEEADADATERGEL